MQFITLRPNIVLIDTENKTHVIRKAETLETMLSNEQIPDYLQLNPTK